MLENYSKDFSISIGYTKPIDNIALVSPSEYPSLPEGKKIELKFTDKELLKSTFKPFQKGLKL